MNWNTAILSTGCIVLGFALGILIGGSIAPPIVGQPWLNAYQGLIGALLGIAGATAGLGVATHNVLRQMRVSLMSREEDRIERLLPGVADAESLLSELIGSIKRWDKAGIEHALRRSNLSDEIDLARDLARRLPRADEFTRKRVEAALWILFAALPLAIPDVEFEREKNPLVRTQQDLQDDLNILITRKSGMRAELESYFAG